MTKIISSTEDFTDFLSNYQSSNVVLIPILADENLHPQNNKLISLYIYLINHDESYLLCFDHDEGNNLNIQILDRLDNDKIKYVYNKKLFLHIHKFTGLVDVNLANHYLTGKPLSIPDVTTTAHNFYNIKFENHKNKNKIVPLVKHIESCEHMKNELMEIIKKYDWELTFGDDSFWFLNNIAIENLQKLESSGLHVDKKVFDKEYDKTKYKHVSPDNLIYTEYNIYTTTGRPSNRFGGINFAALDKNGARKPYVSRFGAKGMLVEFDYDAFHLHLISKLVGEKIPRMNAHTHFGKQYFKKKTLSTEEYEKSKEISFGMLYGGVRKEYEDVPYFAKVKISIKELWKQYKKDGYITSMISGKRLSYQASTDLNPQKLFNYIIQTTEMEYSMIVLDNINKYLADKKTKLILYTYDSFLFDFHIDDGKELLEEIESIMEFKKQFAVKVKRGTNYSEMNLVSKKEKKDLEV